MNCKAENLYVEFPSGITIDILSQNGKFFPKITLQEMIIAKNLYCFYCLTKETFTLKNNLLLLYFQQN